MDTGIVVETGMLLGDGSALLAADEAFDLAEERARYGEDVDIYCLRVPEFGIVVYRVGPDAGWEFTARIFGWGSDAGRGALNLAFPPEGISTQKGTK